MKTYEDSRNLIMTEFLRIDTILDLILYFTIGSLKLHQISCITIYET